MNNHAPEQQIIRPSQLQAQYGVSRSNAYRLMGKNQFPKLIKLSVRSVGWSKKILDAHFGLTSEN